VPRTGRPAIPTELKKRRGTFRVGRANGALVPVPAIGEIKQLMDGPLIQGLVDAGLAPWISNTDLPTVRLAQRLWEDMERLRLALDEEFSEPTFRAYRDVIKELRACLSLLGMTPSDRSRLGVAEVKARSRLEELMDRRGRRAGTPPSPPKPEAQEMVS
jgi:hypothetical protein